MILRFPARRMDALAHVRQSVEHAAVTTTLTLLLAAGAAGLVAVAGWAALRYWRG